MTDLDRQHDDYWFERSCHYAELVGAIDAYTDAGITGDIITADQALAHIRQLVDRFKAGNATAEQTRGGRS